MQIQLCEDCMHVALGDDWTIVDQNTAQRVEHWQTEHAECDIAVVEMLPTLFPGWKFHRVMVHAGSDWQESTRDQIVAWKLAHCQPISMAPDLGDFRAKLLAVAESGKLPERAA